MQLPQDQVSSMRACIKYGLMISCGNRLQASEVQAAQLQAEIATLEKTQLQVEEYKKRADCKSK